MQTEHNLVKDYISWPIRLSDSTSSMNLFHREWNRLDEGSTGISEGRELDLGTTPLTWKHRALDELRRRSVDAQVNLIQLAVPRLVVVALDPRGVTNRVADGAHDALQTVIATIGLNPCSSSFHLRRPPQGFRNQRCDHIVTVEFYLHPVRSEERPPVSSAWELLGSSRAGRGRTRSRCRASPTHGSRTGCRRCLGTLGSATSVAWYSTGPSPATKGNKTAPSNATIARAKKPKMVIMLFGEGNLLLCVAWRLKSGPWFLQSVPILLIITRSWGEEENKIGLGTLEAS